MTKRKDPNIDSRRKSMKDHPNFKGNKYEQMDNETYIGKDSKGNVFYIEKNGLDAVSHYCWSANLTREAKGGLYFCARMSRTSKDCHQLKMLHNFVWELNNGEIPEGKIIDHIDQNPANCKSSNLRLADKTLNAINCGLRINNKSGIIGVNLHKDSWRAYITVEKKQKFLGNYKEKEDAIKARLLAEDEYFKDFAPQKHLFEKYGIEVSNDDQGS